MDQITAFYSHEGTDHKGRTLKNIWNFSDDELEKDHEYIQWLFPTTVKSKFNSNAPIVTPETICELLESKEMVANLIVSSFIFERFLELDEPTPFWTKKINGRDNHNCLRISRVIACLNIFEQYERASDFYEAVLKTYMTKNPSPIYHWDLAQITSHPLGCASPLSTTIVEMMEMEKCLIVPD